ncbi:MAG: 30S ribosomal protein S4 [Candidatus Hydrogenedentota bacterium]|nr:MAG: 30S ribosomal protein S4 [Candidatus Hydrogenedentota bacterium]
MARYTGPVCRKCRREGLKLYLKGEKCFSAKCILEKRNFAPGMGRGSRNAPAAGKISEYGLQLREKQKVRHMYGVLEKQFRKYFATAVRQKGVTGENLLRILERRLDNVVYRMGFAPSRRAARQLVRHGHIRINDRKVNIPSYILRIGDRLTLKKKDLDLVKASVEAARKRSLPEWLKVDLDNRQGEVVSLPTRDSIEVPIKENLIVELYSK